MTTLTYLPAGQPQQGGLGKGGRRGQAALTPLSSGAGFIYLHVFVLYMM